MRVEDFSSIAPLLKEKDIDIDYNALAAFLSRYQPDEWIYPPVLEREFCLDAKTVYEILELCKEHGLVKQYLEVYCPFCQRFTGRRFEYVTGIPDDIVCPYCNKTVAEPKDILQYAIVIYRV